MQFISLIGAVSQAAALSPVEDLSKMGLPFKQYTVRDTFKRNITFYVSESTSRGSKTKLPLIITLQGSGCDSVLLKDQQDRVGLGWPGLLLEASQGRARIMMVEKPGVNRFDVSKNSGVAYGCSPIFLKEHTFERWSQAVIAATKTARNLPGIDSKKVLLLGHSEGGCVAAHVGSTLNFITHIANLSCGGPTQLFDLIILAYRKQSTSESDLQGEKRAKTLLAEWRKIQKNPHSTTSFFEGHPYRYWSSFGKKSIIEDLQKTKSRIFLANGTKDQSVPIESFDLLYASLVSREKDVTAERILNVNHAYERDEKNNTGNGLLKLFTHIVNWFLEKPVQQR